MMSEDAHETETTEEDATHTPSSPPARKSWIKRVVLGLGSILGIILAVVFALLAGAANPLLNSYIDEIGTAVSKDLGRELSISSADVRVFPWLVFELQNVKVDGLASIDKISVRGDTWRALVSLGEDIQVRELGVQGVSLDLARDARGKWNFDHGARATIKEGEESPQDQEELKTEGGKPPQELYKMLKALKLGEVHISDLKVTLRDELTRPGGAPIKLAQLNLDFPTLDLTRQVVAEVSGELLENPEPLSLRLNVGPYDHLFSPKHQSSAPGDEASSSESGESVLGFVSPHSSDQITSLGDEMIPLPLTVDLKTGPLNLGLIAPLIGSAGEVLRQMKTGGSLNVKLTPKEGIHLSGEWSTGGIPTSKGGRLISATLSPKVHVKVGEELSVQVAGTELIVDRMSLRLMGGLKLTEAGPRLLNLGLNTRELELAKLLSLAPQVSSSLPPKSELRGPLALSVQSSGGERSQSLKLLLSLDQARLFLPNQLDKRLGEPLNLRAELDLSPRAMNVKELVFTLGEAALALRGSVGLNPLAPHVDLQAELPSVELSKLARFSPLARATIEQTPARGRLNARLNLKVDGAVSAPKISLGALAQVHNAQLSAPELKVIGGGEIKVDLNSGVGGDFSLSLDGDLSGLAMRFGEVFNKPAKLPLKLQLSATRNQGRLDVPSLSLHIAQLKLQGRGEHNERGFSLKTQLPSSPLKSTLKMFGAARSLGSDFHNARLSFTLEARARTDRQSSLEISLSDLRLKAPQSDLTAQLNVSKDRTLSVKAQVTSRKLNLDKLFPPQPSSASTEVKTTTAPPSSKSTAATDQTGASSEPLPLSLNAMVSVKRGEARGVSFKDLKLKLSATERGLKVETASVKVFGGEARAVPLELTLPSSPRDLAEWRAGLELENIDIKRASSALNGSASTLSGLVSGGFKLNGAGVSWEEISPSLNGEGRISLRRGALSTLKLKSGVFKGLNQAMKVALPKINRRGDRPLKLKTLSGAVRIAEGRLYFDQPLKSESLDGPLLASGYVGLDGSIQLKSTLTLSAQRVSAWVKRRVTQPSQFPINFTIAGSLKKPEIKDMAAVALVSAVAIAYGLSQLDGEQLKGALNQARERAETLVDDAKTEAKAQVKRAKKVVREKVKSAKRQAKRQVKQAREQAEQASKKAQAEAQQKAKEAKRRAEEAKREAEAAQRKAKREAKKRRKQAEDTMKQGSQKLKGLF